MNKFAYINKNGQLCLVIPALKEDLEKVLGPLSDEQYEAHIIERSIPKGTSFSQIMDADIPTSREFRDAWQLENGTITYDLEKARNIQLDKIRAARVPKLVKLDEEFMRALEKGTLPEELVAKKQVLRDITEPLKVMVLKSIEDVEGAFPDELKVIP